MRSKKISLWFNGKPDKIKSLGGVLLAEDTDLMILQVRTDQETSIINAVSNMPGCKLAWYNGISILNFSENTVPLSYSRGQMRAAPSGTIVTAPVLNGDWWIDAINAEAAWGTSRGSTDVKIGVVDSGVPVQQRVIDPSRLSRFDHFGEIPISGDDSPGFHGTWTMGFTAGLIRDPDNDNNIAGKNVMGMNHVSNVMIFDGTHKLDKDNITGRVTYGYPDGSVAQGIKSAIKAGADVINISIGHKGTTGQRKWRLAMDSAVNFAREKNVLLIFAAGNDSIKDDDQLFPEPNEELEDQWRAYTMVVGASQQISGGYAEADFSRDGKVLDIFAPGKDVGFTQNDVKFLGAAMVVEGTSISAPLVTGTASLVKSLDHSLLPAEIKHIIVSSAPSTLTYKDTKRKHLDANAALDSTLLIQGITLYEEPVVQFKNRNDQADVIESITIPSGGVSAMDVLFLIDVTGSYADDIATMQANSVAILNDLSSRGFNVAFGVAAFADFPIYPYGEVGYDDEAFYLIQPITTDSAQAREGINALRTRYGSDIPESQLEALYQCATGAGRDVNGNGDYTDVEDVPPTPVGWRAGAQRVIVFSTDANFHDSAMDPYYPGPTMDATIAALQAAHIMVIGLESGMVNPQMSQIVTATGGTKYGLSSDSSGITMALATAIDSSTAHVNVDYEIIAGNSFLFTIEPAGYIEQTPGSVTSFKFGLINSRDPGTKVQHNDVVLWIKADDSVIGRIHIPIEILAR